MTATHFDIAMAFVAEHEGGFVDDDIDNGGATRYGISLRFLQLAHEDINGDGHVDRADIVALTTVQARAIYQCHFWKHYRLDEIEHPFIAAKIMDLYVNMRGAVAARVVQRCFSTLAPDGILGSKSIRAVNTYASPARLYGALGVGQGSVYQRIVRADKTQDRFLKGWLRRARR